jgi:thiol-disulfide isomerase/thioredoxin
MPLVSTFSAVSLIYILASPFLLAHAFLPNHVAIHRIDDTAFRPLFVKATPSLSGGGTALVESPPETTSPTKWIESLTSLDTFCDYIDNAPVDSLVAVKFYGKSCPLCKRVALKYKKIARFYAKAPIQFAEIEKTVHSQLFDTLKVTTFPYLQIYRNGQCIASHGTESETMFERIVHDTIQNFLMMQPDQWESFLTSFAEPIGKATKNYQSMRELSKGIMSPNT